MSVEGHPLLACTCVLCHTWRRVGYLLVAPGRSEQFRFAALQRLRFLHSELLDLADGVPEGPPVAVGAPLVPSRAGEELPSEEARALAEASSKAGPLAPPAGLKAGIEEKKESPIEGVEREGAAEASSEQKAQAKEADHKKNKKSKKSEKKKNKDKKKRREKSPSEKKADRASRSETGVKEEEPDYSDGTGLGAPHKSPSPKSEPKEKRPSPSSRQAEKTPERGSRREKSSPERTERRKVVSPERRRSKREESPERGRRREGRESPESGRRREGEASRRSERDGSRAPERRERESPGPKREDRPRRRAEETPSPRRDRRERARSSGHHRRSGGHLPPSEPAVPPRQKAPAGPPPGEFGGPSPFWGPRPTWEQKSKGRKRRERNADIWVYGLDESRKFQRKDRGGWAGGGQRRQLFRGDGQHQVLKTLPFVGGEGKTLRSSTQRGSLSILIWLRLRCWKGVIGWCLKKALILRRSASGLERWLGSLWKAVRLKFKCSWQGPSVSLFWSTLQVKTLPWSVLTFVSRAVTRNGLTRT